MATFNFKNYSIYYDIKGSGKPIVFLNGIMMSSASWETFVDTMSENNTFIRVDFIDQGKSSRATEQYTQDLQVELLKELFIELNLDKATIMGISYGGEIAIKFAIQNPTFVDRLILSNTSSRTSKWLKDIGRAWNSIGETLDGNAYYNVAIPVIYSPEFYNRNNEWMENRRKILEPLFATKEFQERMKRLVNSAEDHDCTKDLHKIHCKTLVISSEFDFLVPITEQKILLEHIPNATHVIIPDAGHAAMYEKPLLFMTLVLGFANAKDEDYKI